MNIGISFLSFKGMTKPEIKADKAEANTQSTGLTMQAPISDDVFTSRHRCSQCGCDCGGQGHHDPGNRPWNYRPFPRRRIINYGDSPYGPPPRRNASYGSDIYAPPRSRTASYGDPLIGPPPITRSYGDPIYFPKPVITYGDSVYTPPNRWKGTPADPQYQAL